MVSETCWSHSDVVLILCAGDGVRWNNYLGVPKQLAPLGGVPVLKRSTKLVQELAECVPVVVTADERLAQPATRLFCPARRRWIVETLAATANLWGRSTIVLLGDVFYSREAMRGIFECSGDLIFFGRTGASFLSGKRYGEIFALRFTSSAAPFVLQGLERVIQKAERGGRGKLWELLEDLRTAGRTAVAFQHVEDETDDFDCPEDYRRMVWLYRGFGSQSKAVRTMARIVGLFLFGPHAIWHRWKQWRTDRRRAGENPDLVPRPRPVRLAGYHHPGAFLSAPQYAPLAHE